MTGWLDRLWYGSRRPLWFLWPMAWLYRAVARRRCQQALARLPAQPPFTAPIIVVGNITAGGTGKSPLTAWLVTYLAGQGWRPVIITRGYGGKAGQYPLLATANADPAKAGDEPVMLARQTGCPVVVDPQRARAARWALAKNLGNILVCDDGLQHYALARHLEIAVFDGERGLGNGAPIPVGPLREGPERLATVDFVVGNGGIPQGLDHPQAFVMQLSPTVLRHLRTGETRPVDWLMGKPVRAVAGIGNPARFFDTLSGLGARVRGLDLPDHHRFSRQDLAVEPGEILVMTAKDAVKCHDLAHDHCWVLEVTATLPESFQQALLQKLNRIHLNKA